MLFDYSHIKIDVLEDNWLREKNISLSVLRLDAIHRVISGNKLFKLHYFLEDISSGKILITFGGAYSNHLAATAYACKLSNIKCIGIVRGEKPKELSHTLKQCLNDGMELRFVSREIYDQKEDDGFLKKLEEEFKESIVIPEGGYHFKGAKGVAMIMDLIPDNTTHVCCAVGTATTLAGLLMNHKQKKIIGVPVLKGMHDIESRISFLSENNVDLKQLALLNEYHFGGYAKKTDELITFMNELHKRYQLPTDFVYTGKMMYAIFDQIKKGMFASGSNIVCIHTGGLQGNLSLPKGTLFF
ncbi:1-aminocyclopropane-1-carboxylate deaminase/D-cysteine desulfhydrase [Ferruginibacter sp. SUN002]|uniref:1-aminocyclopropane-1-carboxylate deaminase/D-cysteine desulfhydrase n=1 Tax=Ferruginibacter sp. SUN002 TaxID=2937789 RepID=UPI003D36C89F